MPPHAASTPPGPTSPPPDDPDVGGVFGVWLLAYVGSFIGGLVTIGMLAAIAIPAFLDYSKKSKRSEAELELRGLERSLRAHHAEHGEFPRAAAGPTPSLGSCCATRSRKCLPDSSQWSDDETWSALDFEIIEPSAYSYSYEATDEGQGYVIQAHVDLDCDDNFAVWQITGSASGGYPEPGVLSRPVRSD